MSSAPLPSSAAGGDVVRKIRAGLIEAIRRETAHLGRERTAAGEADEPRFELRYSLTSDDIVAFELYHMSTSPIARKARWRAAVWVTIPGLLLMMLIFRSSMRKGYDVLTALMHTTPLALFLAGYLLIRPRWMRRSIRRYIRRAWAESKNSGMWGSVHLTVNREGVVASDESGQVRANWDAVERVGVLKGHIFLYTSAATAITVPVSAFSSPSQLMRFLQLIAREARIPVACPNCAYNLRGTQDGRCPECGFPE